MGYYEDFVDRNKKTTKRSLFAAICIVLAAILIIIVIFNDFNNFYLFYILIFIILSISIFESISRRRILKDFKKGIEDLEETEKKQVFAKLEDEKPIVINYLNLQIFVGKIFSLILTIILLFLGSYIFYYIFSGKSSGHEDTAGIILGVIMFLMIPFIWIVYFKIFKERTLKKAQERIDKYYKSFKE